MNDAEFEALRAKLLTVFKKWRKAMGLGWWQVTYVWDRDGTATRQAGHDRGGDDAAAMWVKAEWEYLRASITVNMPAVLTEKDDALDSMVRHELAHLLVAELRPVPGQLDADYIQHEERVVTTIATAAKWCWEFGRRDEKRRCKAKKQAEAAAEAAATANQTGQETNDEGTG